MAVKFDLSDIPDTIDVSSAKLKLYIIDCRDYDECYLNVITNDWDADVTWNNRTQSQAWSTGGGDYDSQKQVTITAPVDIEIWEEYDVTTFIQNFLQGNYTNYGFLVRIKKATGIETIKRQYASSDTSEISIRPQLVIESDDIPDTEAPVVSITSPGGDTLKQGTTHTISWIATDNIGVVSRAIYFSSDGISWTLVDSTAGNSGTFEWAVPIVESNNCMIKVFAYDAEGNVGNNISSDFTIEPPTDIIPNTLNINDAKNYMVTILNIQGRVLATFKASNLNNLTQINKSLPSGMHIISITAPGKKNVVRKCLIK